MRTRTPNTLNLLEVRLIVLGNQLGLAGLETGNSVTLNHVRQLAGHHDLVPVLSLSLRGRNRCVCLSGVLLTVRGVVVLQLRSDLLGGETATGSQAAHQVPTQVSVNVQALKGQLTLEEALHIVVLLLGAGLVDERLQQLKLSIRIGLCNACQLPETVSGTVAGLLASLRSHEGMQGSGQVVDLGAQSGGVGLLTNVVQHQVNVLTRRHLSVTHGIPERTPDHAASHGRINVAQVLDSGLDGTLVQANLGVRQVLIVQQQQVGALLTESLLNHGQLAVNVQLDAVGAGQLTVHQVVETNYRTVRAQGLEALSVGLANTQRRDVARLVVLNLNGESVNTSGLKPLSAPRTHVTAGGALQLNQQVIQDGVAPAVLIEVHLQSSHEVLLANPRHHLTQHRSALRVRNAVEVHLNIGKVTDLSHNRVSRRQLILTVRPGLLRCGEGGPRLLRVAGVLRSSQGRHELSERLVQPQVVPPLHGDQVAEPHVSQLVQNGDSAALTQSLRNLGTEDVSLQVSHAASVLHRTGVKLGHEQLIVLLERVRGLELLLVELEALTGQLKHVLSIHERHEGLAGVHAQRNHATLRVGQLAGDLLVGASHNRGNVRRHARGRLEEPGLRTAATALLLLNLHLGLVRHNHPVRGNAHNKLEFSLQVGLLKDGEHAAGVRHLKLGVQVHFAIGGVHETVQTLTGVGVEHLCVNDQGVLGSKVRQLDALAVRQVGAQLFAVEVNGLDRGGDGVNEGGGTFLSVEADFNLRGEDVFVLRKIKFNTVRVHALNDGCAFGCLIAG